MTAEPVANNDPLRPVDSRQVRTAFESGGVQCTARSKRTGNRCRRPAMLGGNVCRAHGGNAPQTRAKAQRRLEQAADALVQRLLSFALDGQVDDPVALRAIVSALDRAGFSVTTKAEVEVGLKPFEQILFTGIDRGVGRDGKPAPQSTPQVPPPPALAPADDATVIDAEVIDEERPRAAPERPSAPTARAPEGDARKRPPPWRNEEPPVQRRPGTALQTMEQAAADLARDGVRPSQRRRGRR